MWTAPLNVVRFDATTLWHFDAGSGRRPPHHSRRGHVDGMSAIAPIATDLLRYGNGRKRPISDICPRFEKEEVAD